MTLFYVALILTIVLVVGFISKTILKNAKIKPKEKKSKPEKPKQEKSKDNENIFLGDYRPVVKSEEESEKEEVFVDDLKREKEPEVIEVKRPSKTPLFEIDEEDDDDLEPYRHFPGLSHKVTEGETLSDRIKDLPDDIKVLLITNALKRKD